MTRFDDVSRLKELEKKAGYDRVEHGAPFRAFMARSAPWLLDAAACFQPGDAEALDSVLEFDACGCDDPYCVRKADALRRLQKAAKIMEGQE